MFLSSGPGMRTRDDPEQLQNHMNQVSKRVFPDPVNIMRKSKYRLIRPCSAEIKLIKVAKYSEGWTGCHYFILIGHAKPDQ